MKNFLKWFNWKEWIISFAKKAAIKVLKEKAPKLRDRVKWEIKKHGPKGIDRAFDGTQKKILALIDKVCPKWNWLKPSVKKISNQVQMRGDVLQEKLKREVAKHGPQIIDRVFVEALSALVQAIEEIELG